MKPLQLTMRAFGAYAGEQIIDFTLLGDKNFFLIHGPTGSGKTTILDAISFALYGSASGDLRESKNLRSDYAPAEQNYLTELFRFKPDKFCNFFRHFVTFCGQRFLAAVSKDFKKGGCCRYLSSALAALLF